MSYAGSVFLPLEAACSLAHSHAALGIVTARSRGQREAQWLWGSGAALEAQVCRVPLNLWAIITMEEHSSCLPPTREANIREHSPVGSGLFLAPGSGPKVEDFIRP